MREGSCRDLAILFCDVCRVMGIAARFVSGYECATVGRADASMHAWAEVYLPGVGWRGYDPSRGLAVANCHVAVAAGFDPELAAPISGLYFGRSGSQMETYLRMELEKANC
jgi:transglutaminase-like putative cysteine protease